MNKQEWKERMRKIKYATKQKGIKWGKKEINVASEMITKPLIKEKPEENWKTRGNTEAIANILNKLRES